MLKLSALEFFLRTIPESFLLVLVAYIFSNEKISKQRFIGASLILSIATYLIRLLPISFGVNTIINMLIFIIIGIYVLKIPINVSILSIFISVIVLSFCEWLNAAMLVKIFNVNKFTNSLTRFIYDLPSLIMFILIVFILYKFMNKIRRILKNVFR